MTILVLCVGVAFVIAGPFIIYKTPKFWAGVAMLSFGMILLAVYIGVSFNLEHNGQRPNQAVYHATTPHHAE